MIDEALYKNFSAASDRIGGRVNTVQASPHGIVELGAQWIHGEEGNVLYQFAKSRNLLHQQVSLDGKGVYSVLYRWEKLSTPFLQSKEC